MMRYLNWYNMSILSERRWNKNVFGEIEKVALFPRWLESLRNKVVKIRSKASPADDDGKDNYWHCSDIIIVQI